MRLVEKRRRGREENGNRLGPTHHEIRLVRGSTWTGELASGGDTEERQSKREPERFHGVGVIVDIGKGGKLSN